ncbi:MAG: hypothetical protein RBR82_17900 [Pseudomonas sp.]|nr:hypothetical protein [Pseudomonas sp.]
MKQKNRFTDKWPLELEPYGYTQVPNLLVEHQHDLGITNSEFTVLLGILRHRQSSKSSWPGPKRLGGYSGLKKLAIQINIRSLEAKGILNLHHRAGTTSKYDVTPLQEKLVSFTHRIKKPIHPYQKSNTVVYQETNTKEEEWKKKKRIRHDSSGKVESVSDIMAARVRGP